MPDAHDANGTPLQKGDRVLIPAVITSLRPGGGAFNVDVRTELGRGRARGNDEFYALGSDQIVKFRNAEPDPPEAEPVYFDPVTGMRPDDVLLDLPDGWKAGQFKPLITELSTELATV